MTNGAERHDIAPVAYVFGPFRVSAGDAVLTRAGKPLALAPRAFDTLAYLVAHAHRTIPSQELLDRIWPETVASDDVLVQSIVEIRRVLGDSANDPKYVQTLPKRGFRFVADVAVDDGRGSVAPVRPRAVVRPWVIGAAVLVAGMGAVAWQVSRVPSGASASTAAYRGEPGTLVVLPIQMVEATSDTAWLRDGLAEIIASEVTHAPGIRVMPRPRVASALRAHGHDGTGVVPLQQGLQVARELRADRLITGSVQRVGDRFTLSARIVDAAGGGVDREVVVEGERRAQLLDAVGDLCRRLTEALAPTPSPEGAADIRGIATPTRSESAYRAYTEALGYEARSGGENSARALALLEDATTSDPSFARAHLRKALVLQTRVRWGHGTDDPAPAVRAALALESGLPDRERLLVAGMGALLLDGRPTRAIEQWTTLLKRYPTYAEEARVPTLVADTLFQLGRWDDLILVTEGHLDTPSLHDSERAVLSALLASAFQRRGEFERAATYAQLSVDLWPAREGPAFLRAQTLHARIQLSLGHRDHALAVFRAVAGDPRADVVNVTDAAWGYYMAGQGGEATRAVQHALTMSPTYGDAHHLRGWLTLTRGGDPSAAITDLRRAFALTSRGVGAPTQGLIASDLAALYYAGVAEQRAGRADTARATWRDVIARSRGIVQTAGDRPDARVVRWEVTCLIALSQARLGEPSVVPTDLEGDDVNSALMRARYFAVVGRRGDALESLRHAISLGATDYQHMNDDPNFDLLRGSPEFVRLLQSVGARS